MFNVRHSGIVGFFVRFRSHDFESVAHLAVRHGYDRSKYAMGFAGTQLNRRFQDYVLYCVFQVIFTCPVLLQIQPSHASSIRPVAGTSGYRDTYSAKEDFRQNDTMHHHRSRA